MRHRGIVALLMAMLLLTFAPAVASADHDEGPWKVWFPETGHTLKDGFLGHWRHHGELPILGYPLTEEFVDKQTNRPTQYFERAVMEWHAENEGQWQVLLRRLGAELVEDRMNERPFRGVTGEAENCTYYSETQHRLCNGFRDYWETHGGLWMFGYPLSEEFTEDGRTVQYFERARFEWHPENAGTPWEILLGRLGADAATADKVDQSPVAQPSDVPSYDPGLWSVPQPEPEEPDYYLPAGAPTWASQWIDVNLSEQYMTAYEYGTPILGTYVSTGTWDYPTPTGYFEVYYKLRYDDMTSGLAVPPGEYYYVEDVPHVMYFAAGGYAIHGAYWHNMFGTPYSHGCVSTPLWAAEWFYNWAWYGTTVYIHY
jgi:hypothetical protein